MLSHSTSSTTNNPRRSKSNQSIQRRPSTSSSVDPYITKQHALVAANIAFERAHSKETPQFWEQSPQLSRTRSSRASKFEGEGSHFNNSQTPGGRFRKRQPYSANLQLDHPRTMRDTLSSDRSSHDYTTGVNATCKPSNDSIQDDARFKQHRSSISVHRLRRAKSMYPSTDDGRSTCIEDISFGPPSFPPRPPPMFEDIVVSLPELDMEKSLDTDATNLLPLTRTNLEGIKPQLLAIRPSATRDVNAHTIRHRASLMLTPFKKRRDKSGLTSPSTGLTLLQDNQHANAIHSTVCPGPTALTSKQRKTSSEGAKKDSLKSRILSVFRKTSAGPMELPVQQVSARRAYFGNSSIGNSSSGVDDSFHATQWPVPYAQSQLRPFKPTTYDPVRGASPASSEITHATKSRVTSWADSTIAGTILDVVEDLHLPAIEEETQRKPSSAKEQRRQSSFNLFNRALKGGRAELPYSDKSDIVQNSSDNGSASRTISRLSASSRKASLAWETLPSQLKKIATLTKHGIREVSAEESADHARSTSDFHVTIEPLEKGLALDDDLFFIRSVQTRRKPVPRLNAVPPPTVGRSETRLRRSNERWQEPLDAGRSLFFPRSAKTASPNQLLVSAHEGGPESKPDVVFSTPKHGITHSRSTNAASPSIYSQDEACQNLDDIFTSLPQTSIQDCPGTAVILADTLAVKYIVGSPKKSVDMEPEKSSKDWKKWLQSEVQDLESPDKILTLRPRFIEKSKGSGHHREETQIYDDEDASSFDEGISDKLKAFGGADPSIKRWSDLSRITSQSTIEKLHTDDVELCSRSQTIPTDETLARAAVDNARVVERCWAESRGRKMTSRHTPEDRQFNRLQNNSSTHAARPSSRMNERFPYLENSRPQSRASRPQSRASQTRSTPVQSVHSRSSRPVVVARRPSGDNKENTTPKSIEFLPNRPVLTRPAIRRPLSTAALGRSCSTFTEHTQNNDDGSLANLDPMVNRQPPSFIPRPIPSSSQSPAHSLDHACSSDVLVRKIGTTSCTMFENDPTLINIMQGPYHESASPRPLSVRKVTAYSRENSPLKENSAPAIMTCEQIATPSGGQRLAEQFLHARRFREDMNVLSPTCGSPSRGGVHDLTELNSAFL